MEDVDDALAANRPAVHYAKTRSIQSSEHGPRLPVTKLVYVTMHHRNMYKTSNQAEPLHTENA